MECALQQNAIALWFVSRWGWGSQLSGRISLLSVLNLQTTLIICTVSQSRVIVTRYEYICIAPDFFFYFVLWTKTLTRITAWIALLSLRQSRLVVYEPARSSSEIVRYRFFPIPSDSSFAFITISGRLFQLTSHSTVNSVWWWEQLPSC
jgi:hypothetical protein